MNNAKLIAFMLSIPFTSLSQASEVKSYPAETTAIVKHGPIYYENELSLCISVDDKSHYLYKGDFLGGSGADGVYLSRGEYKASEINKGTPFPDELYVELLANYTPPNNVVSGNMKEYPGGEYISEYFGVDLHGGKTKYGINGVIAHSGLQSGPCPTLYELLKDSLMQ